MQMHPFFCFVQALKIKSGNIVPAFAPKKYRKLNLLILFACKNRLL
jgi:hypothetical protein